ncbi:Lrp/AsnC family transcriptional regulator [Acinetobacter sp. ANC 4178]|uniref:Lrp/AsnC family transcriptional regulator n=1 Tax=Acinetobacter sp. ANC 4178 TaxID=2529839 RepID=UPI00103D3F9E|nr:Lrp/AsnC family transcriptional regulator [Acinetobacter sp. ANC 4178]TCB67529.1 Lrp/AsnC family transcriptional regulator [Acinetobacter sp. ANC 4178]
MSDELDDYDRKIIQQLQQNGRLTNQELAELIGLSASQCSRRRATLEQKKIITGYYAQIALKADPSPITGMIEVSIRNHYDAGFEKFLEFILDEPRIRDAYKLTGTSDFLLKVAVKNLDEMSQLISKISSHQFQINDITTSIVLEKLKENSIVLSNPVTNTEVL